MKIKPRKPINTLTRTTKELKIVAKLHKQSWVRKQAIKTLARLNKQMKHQREFWINFVDEDKNEQEVIDRIDAENSAREAYELYANHIAEFHDYHCKLEDGDIPTHMSFKQYLASIYTNYETKRADVAYRSSSAKQSAETKSFINDLFKPLFDELEIDYV